MESIISLFTVLEKVIKTPLLLILFILMGYMFFQLHNMSNDMKGIKKDITGITKDISQINAKLDNHIGDTNKKIERLSDRFDRLYEILLDKSVKK